MLLADICTLVSSSGDASHCILLSKPLSREILAYLYVQFNKLLHLGRKLDKRKKAYGKRCCVYVNIIHYGTSDIAVERFQQESAFGYFRDSTTAIQLSVHFSGY